MSKDLDANVVTQLDAQEKSMVLLFELVLTGLTLKYAAYKRNVVFPHGGATTYSAKAVMFNGVSQSLEGQIGRITVKFDNVSKDMAAYLDAYDFEGRTLTVKRVYLDSDVHAPATDTEYVEIFSGVMEQPKEVGRNWLTVTATEGKPLKKKVLQETYNIPCGHRFGDSNTCNVDGNSDLTSLTASGTADSGSVSTLVHSSLTQADDFWNYGAIEITKDGKTYKRKVDDFDAGTDTITFDIVLPVAVDGTCTYVVYKGCDKTWDTCGGNSAFGPSADNQLNYGGFLHIGDEANATKNITQNNPVESINIGGSGGFSPQIGSVGGGR